MMKLIGLFAVGLLMLALLLALYTFFGARSLSRENPPQGAFIAIDEQKFHFLWRGAENQTAAESNFQTYVFIHGASGNAMDQFHAFEPHMPKAANRLYLDRPGHGWSERGQGDGNIKQQSAKLLTFLETIGREKGFEQFTLIGHSFGGAVAMEMMLQNNGMINNALLLAPATHPWPSGVSTWYNELTVKPVIGPLFAHILAYPFGKQRTASGARCVFAPNPMPDDYVEKTGIDLVLRPQNFIANAEDVAGLYDHVVARNGDYSKVTLPVTIIAGDRDTVVADWIHTDGLAEDLTNVQTFTLHNLGHKPDYAARDLAIAAMENLNGATHDLALIARNIEAEIANDTSGPCDKALRLKRDEIDNAQKKVG